MDAGAVGRAWKQLWGLTDTSRQALAWWLAGTALLGMALVPPNPAVLDVALCLGAVAPLLVLLAVLGARRRKDLAWLPAALLGTTLMRLAINLASTRLILAQGEGGELIAAVGALVLQDQLLVGGAMFALLLVVQRVVVSHGAERVAEVAARFALDALPGQQMSIDADVRSQAIEPSRARHERARLADHTRLLGAMDGTMKFVRGESLAGLAITAVNLVAGVALGSSRDNLGLGPSLEHYGMLAVGDGIVTQLPSLLTATAAVLAVVRPMEEERSQTGKRRPETLSAWQARARDPAVAVALGLLGLGLMPGLPARAFWPAALVVGAWAWVRRGSSASGQAQGGDVQWPGTVRRQGRTRPSADAPKALILWIDPGVLCVLRSEGTGWLDARWQQMRESLWERRGIELPPLHVEVRSMEDPGHAVLAVHGIARAGPWALPVAGGPGGYENWREGLADGLRMALEAFAHELLDPEGLRCLVDAVRLRDPGLVDELVPARLSHTQLLLLARDAARHGLCLRYTARLLAPLLEQGACVKALRERLSADLAAHWLAPTRQVYPLILSPEFEEELREGLRRGARGRPALLSAQVREGMVHGVWRAIREAWRAGGEPVVLVDLELRTALEEALWARGVWVVILAWNELVAWPSVKLQGVIALAGSGEDLGDDALDGLAGFESHAQILA